MIVAVARHLHVRVARVMAMGDESDGRVAACCGRVYVVGVVGGDDAVGVRSEPFDVQRVRRFLRVISAMTAGFVVSAVFSQRVGCSFGVMFSAPALLRRCVRACLRSWAR